MMKELLVATGNKGKLREVAEILKGCVDTILSPADFPGLPDVEEDGDTFEANALKKARSAALATGKAVIADDSGLCVDALGGAPGVISARYAGEGATDQKNNEKLLEALAGVPEERRGAAFHCVIALCLPDGTCHTFDGAVPGVMLEEGRGDGGFGYDPLFLVTQFGKTLSELSLEEKNGISHRGKALELLKEHLKRNNYTA